MPPTQVSKQTTLLFHKPLSLVTARPVAGGPAGSWFEIKLVSRWSGVSSQVTRQPRQQPSEPPGGSPAAVPRPRLPAAGGDWAGLDSNLLGLKPLPSSHCSLHPGRQLLVAPAQQLVAAGGQAGGGVGGQVSPGRSAQPKLVSLGGASRTCGHLGVADPAGISLVSLHTL